MNPEQLKAILPQIQYKTNYNIEEVYSRPLSPKTLGKQSYLEIFNSQKQSMRKPLNFINYSNENYNVISNNLMTNDLYNKYFDKRLDYDSQIPQYREGAHNLNISKKDYNAITFRFLEPDKISEINQNRKLVRLNMKSHILRNIKKIKDRSSLSGTAQESSI